MERDLESAVEGKRHYKPIEKASGVTQAEKYLGHLCEKTFLSLWSYPGVYRDQGKPVGGGHGKEICDLLVAFGEHIIIFSDKDCELQDSGNGRLDWQRWFRRAIIKSAEQSWGAERWIRQNPERIFLDRECKQRLPIALPEIGNAKFHLVVVAHGISPRIRREYGGSGSLMIDTALKGSCMHTEPFYVGDLDPQRTLVHVFDDDSLFTLMTARDTISDFVAYLSRRETLFRAQTAIIATGEEELLGIYLKKVNNAGEHDFILPVPAGAKVTHFLIPEGHWEDFQKSPQRTRQLAEDRISYLWDDLIEKFNFHALKANQHFVTPGGIRDAETIFRFMAREPRWKRRYFSLMLADMLRTTPPSHRAVRVLPSLTNGDPFYVFLLLPMPSSASVFYERYREVRRDLLAECCKVVRLKYPDAKDIVGLATEPGLKADGRSEDAIYFDARKWTTNMQNEAKELQEKLGILQKATEHHIQIAEYPEAPASDRRPKN
jgi:hypothetical protein